MLVGRLNGAPDFGASRAISAVKMLLYASSIAIYYSYYSEMKNADFATAFFGATGFVEALVFSFINFNYN